VQDVVIVGAGGRLGAALVREYATEFSVRGLNHAQLDIGNFEQARRTLGQLEFDVLINCAAQTNVDRCETEREEAFRLNDEAPGVLAQICSAKGARLLHISTDYVFDGEKREAYTEEDEARPISVYGESKLDGERRVLAVDSRHIVARVSWVFGPDRPSFVDALIKRARNEERVDAIADKWSTPSYTIDLAAMLRPLIANESAAGIFHLTNGGACSWQEYAQWAIDCCVKAGVSLKGRHVEPLKLSDMKNFVARRPPYTVLSTAKFQSATGVVPRDWRDAVREYVREHVAA
jgi:dTDP-4-dehydrorhamnose reductase